MANSFFQKLKKGMGIELPTKQEEELEEIKLPEEELIIEETPIAEKKPTTKKKKEKIDKEIKFKKKAPKKKATKIVTKEILKTESIEIEDLGGQRDWMEAEGQLAIDVYQTEKELVIISAIAGIKSEEIDITVEGDLVNIRGKREKPFIEEEDYFTKECYWGPFSREIILPTEVDPERTKASMKSGILTIRIPKIIKDQKTVIRIKDSE